MVIFTPTMAYVIPENFFVLLYIIINILPDYDDDVNTAQEFARAERLYTNWVMKHRKVYNRTKCRYYREKDARYGHKGQYRQGKVKGQTKPGNIAYDLD